MPRLIECVPNFSEGRDPKVIERIKGSIAGVNAVRVLNVDPGEAANRTVITFVGEPEAVVEAAFRAVRTAQELIDMRRHKGVHPRIGATDVLPLVPIEGVTLEECADMARALARRIFDELGIPTYCYEAAAKDERHRNLAVCRQGEYEGLRERIEHGDAPDFCDGWNDTVARSGASVVGARNFLIAVNFNLNTRDSALAHDIACELRQKGRKVNGEWVPGLLKGVKSIGWYIEEYGIAQVSMNITDIEATPLHVAYNAACRAAEQRGVRVTGTEIIGLVPRRCLIEAGRYFSGLYDLDEEDAMVLAICKMNLDELRPFKDKTI